jgi:hypothetical protein
LDKGTKVYFHATIVEEFEKFFRLTKPIVVWNFLIIFIETFIFFTVIRIVFIKLKPIIICFYLRVWVF